MTHVEKRPRVVCAGWGDVHTETRVLSEGSEPVSHGMCADCERVVNENDCPECGWVKGQSGADSCRCSDVPRAPKPGADALRASLPTLLALLGRKTNDSRPDAGGFLCGECGFTSTTGDVMLAHTCGGAERRQPNLHWLTDGGP